jgi:hypothetical protein
MLNGASAWFGLTEHQAGSFHPHYDTSNDRSRVREILMTIHRPPAVGGQPRLFLQLEGGALLAVATAFYAWGGAPWWIFAVLFFAPDIAFLAYFVGPRVGAFTYNVMHTTLAPATLVGVAVLYEYPALATIGAAIWGAHIGYDRMLGYGLKYPVGYKFTHLGQLWWPPEGGGWLPRRPGAESR